jgi:hypothetical protein
VNTDDRKWPPARPARSGEAAEVAAPRRRTRLLTMLAYGAFLLPVLALLVGFVAEQGLGLEFSLALAVLAAGTLSVPAMVMAVIALAREKDMFHSGVLTAAVLISAGIAFLGLLALFGVLNFMGGFA